jgi:hypothetical protein
LSVILKNCGPYESRCSRRRRCKDDPSAADYGEEHGGSHTEFIDQFAWLLFGIVNSGSAHCSQSIAAAAADIQESYHFLHASCLILYVQFAVIITELVIYANKYHPIA